MPTTARLDLRVWRNDDVYEYPLRVRGLDLTGAALRMQVRLRPDTPGNPLVDLGSVTNGNAQGLRVAGVSSENGVPVTDLRIRINKSTLQALPYSGEMGDSSPLAYALLISGRTRLIGDFIVLAHAYGSDAAPTQRPEGCGDGNGTPTGAATLTIAAEDITVIAIDDAALSIAAASQATAAANLAQIAAEGAIAAGRYFPSRAAGEAGSAVGQLFSTDDGAGNVIYYRRTSTGSVEIGRALTPVSLLATLKPLKDKLSQFVFVTDYGAAVDGVTNDTAAVNAANVAASIFGKTVFFPAGSGACMIDPVQGLANWAGERGSAVKYRGNSTGFTALATFDSLSDIAVEGLTFDGAVSDDPANWATGFDSFRGSSGVSFVNCKRVRISHCRGVNTNWSGIRAVLCEDVLISGCVTMHNRGKFGDGVFIDRCQRVSVSSVFAQDYTRIGVTVDSSQSGTLCQKVSLTDVFATNGHHGSALYGDTEFNAGIWCENAADISVSNSFATQNTHRGINLCSGEKPADFAGTHASILVSNSHVDGGPNGSSWGIYTYSLAGLPVKARIVNCSSKRCTFGYEGLANTNLDSFSWVNCDAYYDASVTVGKGFSTIVGVAPGLTKPVFTVGQGCTVQRWKLNDNYLSDPTGASTADIGSPVVEMKGAMDLRVSGVTNPDGLPIVVKWFGDFAHDFTARDRMKLRVVRGGSVGGTIDVQGTSISELSVQYGHSDTATILGNRVTGLIHTNALQNVFQDNIVPILETNYVWLDSEAGLNFPACDVKNNRFSKNIANGYVLRLGFGNTDAWQAILENNTFVNTGAPQSTKPWLSYAGNVKRVWDGNWADASVTNITMLDSGGGAEDVVVGVTKIAMR